MNASDGRRQHAVARHDVKNPHLSEQRRQHHRRISRNAADRDDQVKRAIFGRRPERVEHGRPVGELVEAEHAHRAQRQRHVQRGAEHEREDDADRNVALGALGFFRSHGYRVEADVRIEYQSGARENSVIPKGRKRMEIGGLDGVRDDGHEHDHRDDLHDDQRPVDARRFANADRYQRRDPERDDAPRTNRSADGHRRRWRSAPTSGNTMPTLASRC